jgi:hypothetical protein
MRPRSRSESPAHSYRSNRAGDTRSPGRRRCTHHGWRDRHPARCSRCPRSSPREAQCRRPEDRLAPGSQDPQHNRRWLRTDRLPRCRLLRCRGHHRYRRRPARNREKGPISRPPASASAWAHWLQPRCQECKCARPGARTSKYLHGEHRSLRNPSLLTACSPQLSAASPPRQRELRHTALSPGQSSPRALTAVRRSRSPEPVSSDVAF